MLNIYKTLQKGYSEMVRGGSEIIAAYGIGSLANSSLSPLKGMNTTGPGKPPLPVGDGEPRTREVIPYQNQFPETQWDTEVRFATLRGVARCFAPAASSISTRVRQVRNSTLSVTMRDPKAQKDIAAINAVEDFLSYPDFDNEYSIEQWLSFGERDVQEVGGFAFQIRRDRVGRVCGLKALDFATIRRQTGAHGEVPKPPDFAFTQVLFGEDVGNFYSRDIWYEYPDPVSNELYPRSNTDDALSVLVTAILDQISETDLRRHHSHLTVFITGPEGTNGQELAKVAAGIRREVNRRMSSGDGVVNIVPVPNGSQVTNLQGIIFDLGREELKRRDVRACYGLSPTPFVRDNNRGTAEEQGDDENNGLVDRLGWWGRLLTRVTRDLLGYRQLTVKLVREVERDEVAHATAQKLRLDAGLTDVDQERHLDGMEDSPALQALWLEKQRALAAGPSVPGQIPGMPAGPKAPEPNATPEPAKPAAAEPSPVNNGITFNPEEAAKAAPEARREPSNQLRSVIDEIGRLRTERLIRLAEEQYDEQKAKAAQGGDVA